VPRLAIDSDTAIHYQCLGQGEDLVLIHGLGANLAFWYMGIARRLARQYRVIMYDLRGHGRSSMPPSGYSLPDMAHDLRSLLDHLEVDRAHVVGHSFGARVGLYFTLAHQERVRTLTAADTQVRCLQDQVRLGDWPHWKLWKQQLQAQGFHSLPPENERINFQMLAHFNQLSQSFAHGALNKSRRAPSLRHRDMGARGARRWEQLMKATSAELELKDETPLTLERIRQISVPTLALFGEYSHCLASCEQLNRYIWPCKVKILPEVGHFLPAIKPRLFLHSLRQFIQQSRNGPRQVRIRTHSDPPGAERRVGERRNLERRSINYPLKDRDGELVRFDRRKPLYDPATVSHQ
jgi:pimeloyl-ACP methyl ester carboxylesterase